MRAFVVDSFTDKAFRGNPAGVVLLDAPADSVWMQAVAAELRHSETAFVVADSAGYGLRWFTPAVEVDLCGHATLATAHALHSIGVVGPFVFRTRSGVLTADVAPDGLITLDFPATVVAPIPPVPGLAAALGVEVTAMFGNGVDVVVEVRDRATVRDLRPDIAALAEVECRGVAVTAASDDVGVDFVSRFFAPRVGVHEDPVTGSAHCSLAPLWADRLGRTRLVGEQLSARGGRVEVDVRGERVLLGGHAVTVIAGDLLV